MTNLTITITITIENADAHLSLETVKKNLLDEFDEMFEGETVPPTTIELTMNDGSSKVIRTFKEE